MGSVICMGSIDRQNLIRALLCRHLYHQSRLISGSLTFIASAHCAIVQYWLPSATVRWSENRDMTVVMLYCG
jgi:hypothetical protein